MVMKKGNAEAANAYPLKPRDTLIRRVRYRRAFDHEHTNGGSGLTVYDLSTAAAQEVCFGILVAAAAAAAAQQPATGVADKNTESSAPSVAVTAKGLELGGDWYQSHCYYITAIDIMFTDRRIVSILLKEPPPQSLSVPFNPIALPFLHHQPLIQRCVDGYGPIPSVYMNLKVDWSIRYADLKEVKFSATSHTIKLSSAVSGKKHGTFRLIADR